MDRTGSRLLVLFVACFAFGLNTVFGQDVDVSSRSANASEAVDYASIIRFASSRDRVDGGRVHTVSTERLDLGPLEPAVGGTRPAALASDPRVSGVTRPATLSPEDGRLSDGSVPADSSVTPSAVAPARNVASAASLTLHESRRASSSIISEPEDESVVAEEMRRRVDRPMHSQGLRRSQHVETWEIPDEWSPGAAEAEWPDWVFSGADLYVEEAPPYAGIAPLPLFYVHAPIETKLMSKVKKLARNKAFREVRRHVKRRWRKLFRDSPTMRFETYEETLAKINHIGKGGDKVDQFNEEYMANITRDHVFQREDRDGEADIPLFTWGPLTVTAEGDVRFDMGTAASGDEEIVVRQVEVGEKKTKPLFSGRDYKLNTSLSLSLNDDFTGGQNYLPFLSSYGVEVEVEWLSDILGREMVGAELEVEWDDDGDVAAFVNFVIKSRR